MIKFQIKLILFFSDFNLVDYGNLPYEGNFQKVNFYTDLSCFKIILKQSHIILKFINECKKYEENFSIFGIINDKGIVNDTIVRRLIYQLKNPLNYYSKKSKNNCPITTLQTCICIPYSVGLALDRPQTQKVTLVRKQKY